MLNMREGFCVVIDSQFAHKKELIIIILSYYMKVIKNITFIINKRKKKEDLIVYHLVERVSLINLIIFL